MQDHHVLLRNAQQALILEAEGIEPGGIVGAHPIVNAFDHITSRARFLAMVPVRLFDYYDIFGYCDRRQGALVP